MPRHAWTCLLLLLPALARADSGRTTPGLVIETGARHAVADGISFSPDGTELFAWGEDKVIRRWGVGLRGFLDERSTNLRWPILREQRGSVFTLAHSPDGPKVAIAGLGVKTGLVALLDLKGGPGAVVDPLPETSNVNWAIAFSPDGKSVVYGNEFGYIYRWRPGTKGAATFKGSGGKAVNRVRLVAFTGPDTFISVSMDGVVKRWDVTDTTAESVEVARFTVPNVFRVALSPSKRWIAAAGQTLKGTDEEARAIGAVELIDLEAAAPAPTRVQVPDGDGTKRAVRCLAFDAGSDLLAVGCQDFPADLKKRDFFRVVGGTVVIRDLKKGEWRDPPITLTYRADSVAFHPKRSKVLATAGGNDHEVSLWDATTGKPLGARAVVRSPGACIWGVAFSKDGQSFGWQNRRAANPSGENDWGAGPWRVFDRVKIAIRTNDRGFQAVAPVAELDGWKIDPTTAAGVWEVVGPKGTRVAIDGDLYNRRYNQEPRCWTFIQPAKRGGPVRLAIGHQWGASLYECSPGEVRLVRVFSGHEGEVMSIAPSSDGNLLLTGSRDQTICCWSLAPWKAKSEIGASFEVKDGKIVVTQVDDGSPVWEPLNPLRGTDEHANRLKKDDVIDLVFINGEKFVYDPKGLYEAEVEARRLNRITDKVSINAKDAVKRLMAAKPAYEYILGKRFADKGPLVYKFTTVRQRPLWRFFTTRSTAGNEWVIWRPRDFYYDTSANGDKFVGWHVNDPNLAAPPAFHPLERYRGTERVGKAGVPNGFHRRDKIWPALMDPSPPVDSFLFTDIEAPRVDVAIPKPVAGAANLEVTITATPPDPDKVGQKIARVVVYVEATEVPIIAPKVDKRGVIDRATIAIPREYLRWGPNTVKVSVFNETGGRGDAEAVTEYTPPGKPTSTLHALCVGISNYDDAPGEKGSDGVPNLICSTNDAEEMARVLEEHARSGGFGKSNVKLIRQKDATAPRIMAVLRELSAAAKPDDWIVVYLSGHGSAEWARGPDGKYLYEGTGRKKKRVPVKGTYFYVCRDFDEEKPSTKLTSNALFKELASAKARKMVILDTCHAGGATVIPADLVRDFTPDSIPFQVIAACQDNQQALEPIEKTEKYKHGFFTHALLEIINPALEEKKGVGKRLKGVPSVELQAKLPEELSKVLAVFKVKKGDVSEEFYYHPAFNLPGPKSTTVLYKHGDGK